MIAVVFPASASKVILLNTGLSAPSNVKLTSSNFKVPCTLLSLSSWIFSLSKTVISVPNTSSIRPAATSARGNCIIKNVKNRNDITICIVYVINAIISPTWILPASIFFPPIQIISSAIPFIINIIAGNSADIVLLTKSWLFLKVTFSLSNRSSSCFSRPNTRITETPVKSSRVTRLTLSTSFCIILNFGITKNVIIPSNNPNKPTPTAIIQVIPVSVWVTL